MYLCSINEGKRLCMNIQSIGSSSSTYQTGGTSDSSTKIEALEKQEETLETQLKQLESQKSDQEDQQKQVQVIQAQIQQIEAQIQQLKSRSSQNGNTSGAQAQSQVASNQIEAGAAVSEQSQDGDQLTISQNSLAQSE